MLTAFASISTPIEAMKLGACQYMAKSFYTDDIEAVLDHGAGQAEVEVTNCTTSVKAFE